VNQQRPLQTVNQHRDRFVGTLAPANRSYNSYYSTPLGAVKNLSPLAVIFDKKIKIVRYIIRGIPGTPYSSRSGDDRDMGETPEPPKKHRRRAEQMGAG
jgi:hypothetical protein